MREQPYETVATMQVRRLYRYQRFDLERLSALLTQRTVYFSNPDEFSDPWDCKPWFKTPDTAAERERLIQWFDRVSREHDPHPNEELRAREIQRLRDNPDFLRARIEDISRATAAEMDRRYRVYCLTTKPACPLMWAHYADKHRGICMELDVWQEDLCSAIKVQYRDTYPLFPLDDGTDISPFYTKSAGWQYEDEYRLIAEEQGHAFSDGTLKTQNGIYTLPRGTLKSIIVGAQAPPGIREQINEMVSRDRDGVIVRDARCSPDRYQLILTPPLDT
jgi:Protein of unknown function (DUF2971)